MPPKGSGAARVKFPKGKGSRWDEPDREMPAKIASFPFSIGPSECPSLAEKR